MSSEIKVSSVKAKDGTAGISIADSTGNVSLSGSLSAGTIGSNVTIADGANPHGWEHIKTIAFTADTSTDWTSNSGANKMDNVISNKYSAYKLIIQWGGGDGTMSDVYFRFIDASGNVEDGSNYNYGYQHVTEAGNEAAVFNGQDSSYAQIGNDIVSGAKGWNGEITFWNLFSGQSNFPQVDGHQLTYNSRDYTYYPQAWYKCTSYDYNDYYQGGIGSFNYNSNTYVRGFVIYFNAYNDVQKDSWWSCYGLKLPTAD